MATDSGNAPVVVFDCETTGLGRHDRIVEIAVVTLDPVTLEITDEYDTLVNPERDVGPVGLHGITPPMVEAAPVFEEVVAALARRLHGRTLVSHNLPFDVRMLRYEFERMGAAFSPGAGVCTQKATRQKLSAACDMLGIELEHQHRALADARATARVLRQMTEDDRVHEIAEALGDSGITEAQELAAEIVRSGIRFKFVDKPLRVVSADEYHAWEAVASIASSHGAPPDTNKSDDWRPRTRDPEHVWLAYNQRLDLVPSDDEQLLAEIDLEQLGLPSGFEPPRL